MVAPPLTGARTGVAHPLPGTPSTKVAPPLTGAWTTVARPGTPGTMVAPPLSMLARYRDDILDLIEEETFEDIQSVITDEI